jgi:tetratricopeptide (TPR) repeat protein
VKWEAIAEYQKAMEMSGGDEGVAASLSYAYAVSGRRAEAENILHVLERKSKTAYVSPYVFATTYAVLGENDRALEFLEQAYPREICRLHWGS